MRRALAATAALCAAIAGCGGSDANIQPSTFQRPGALTFVCFEFEGDARQRDTRSDARPVPLSECEEPGTRRALTALLSQTARGELAPVDLRLNRILDSRADVPGFTFARVGEAPSAVVVPPERPATAYVATLGARGVQAVPTASLHPEAEAANGIEQFLQLEGAPSDLVLGPDASRLYAPLPRNGAVAEIPLAEDGRMEADELRVIPVGTRAAEPVEPDTLPPNAQPAAYRKVCPPSAAPAPATDAGMPADGGAPDGGPGDAGLPDAGASDGGPGDAGARDAGASDARAGDAAVDAGADGGTMAPDAGGGGDAGPAPGSPRPRPRSIAVDRRGSRLYVSDVGLPVIHVLEVGSNGARVARPPINVGTTTREIALTPTVPARLGREAGEDPARYLYAVDATDQSVLVMDALEGSPSFGTVLPVARRTTLGAEAQRRLDVVSNATSLEVLTPNLQGTYCEVDGPRAEQIGPARLRGVFLAVGLSNGDVQFFDVHDLDAPCRGGADCMSPPIDGDNQVFISRHRGRIGTLVRNGVSLVGTPRFEVDGVPGRLEPDGDVSGADGAPELQQLSCPEGMAPVFPQMPEQEQTGLVCSLTSPWAVRAETWNVVWEGTIPGSGNGRGRFLRGDDNDGFDFEARGARLCEQGVLGAEDFDEEDLPEGVDPDDVPELDYGGDALVITSSLPEDLPDNLQDTCQGAFGEDAVGGRDEVAFPIRRTGTSEDGHPRLALAEGPALMQAKDCFVELVEFEVRTRGAFTVSGTRSGFLHRVVQDEDGSCTVDVSQDPRLRGRVGFRTRYENPLVAFELGERPQGFGDEAALSFEVGDVPAPLRVTTGTLTGPIEFSETDGRLYVVDVGARQFSQLELDPLTVTRTFE